MNDILIQGIFVNLLLIVWFSYIDPILHEYSHAKELVKLGDTPVVTLRTKVINKDITVKGVLFCFRRKVNNKTFSNCNFVKYSDKEIRRVALAGIVITYLTVAVMSVIFITLMILQENVMIKFIYFVALTGIFILILLSTFVGFLNKMSDFRIVINPRKFRKNMEEEVGRGINQYSEVLEQL